MKAQGLSWPGAIVTVSISDSLFDNNLASSGGALYASYGFDFTVERTKFIDNGAYSFGGVAMGGAANLETDGSASFVGCNFTRGWGFHGGGGEPFFVCLIFFERSEFLFFYKSGYWTVTAEVVVPL